MDKVKEIEEQLQAKTNALIMLRAQAFELHKGYEVVCEKEKAQETVVLELRAMLAQAKAEQVEQVEPMSPPGPTAPTLVERTNERANTE